MTSLYHFQKEISLGNDFLTITEMLLKTRRETIQDILVFPLLGVGELLVSDRQTVKVEKMFQINFVCVVTDLISLSNNSRLSGDIQVDFKTCLQLNSRSIIK